MSSLQKSVTCRKQSGTVQQTILTVPSVCLFVARATRSSTQPYWPTSLCPFLLLCWPQGMMGRCLMSPPPSRVIRPTRTSSRCESDTHTPVTLLHYDLSHVIQRDKRPHSWICDMLHVVLDVVGIEKKILFLKFMSFLCLWFKTWRCYLKLSRDCLWH